MKIKHLILIMLFLISSVTPVYADDLIDGWVAFAKGDYSTAFKKLKPLAEQGDIQAASYLGYIYTDGLGGADYKEALKWNKKAAEAGHPMAQNNLGSMYLKGSGISNDEGTGKVKVRHH